MRPSDVPPDDARELFATAWCLHPHFIPDEQVIFIPELRILGPVEAAAAELPGLRYLVRIRVVAFQDGGATSPLMMGEMTMTMMLTVAMAMTRVGTVQT